jgi:hypothetical protein
MIGTFDLKIAVRLKDIHIFISMIVSNISEETVFWPLSLLAVSTTINNTIMYLLFFIK